MAQVEKIKFSSISEARERESVRWNKKILLFGLLALALVVLVLYTRLSTGATVADTSAPGINTHGMAIYQQSERGRASLPQANNSGLAIYHQSEWGYNQPLILGLTDEGLTIYHESERHATPRSAE